jgi:hypothetical protein
LSRVACNTVKGRGYDADQGSVWKDVNEYLTKSQVRSATSAYADGYRVRAREVEKSLDGLGSEPGQVGIAAVVGERVLGLDLFGSAKLYERAWRKVVRGVLAETHEPSDRSPDPAKLVASVLASLGGLKAIVRKVPGCGETIHGTAGLVAMGAIAAKGTVYHTYVAQL